MILISDDHMKIIREPKTIVIDDFFVIEPLFTIKVDGYVFGYYKSRKTALAEMKNISDMMATNKTYQVHSSEE